MKRHETDRRAFLNTSRWWLSLLLIAALPSVLNAIQPDAEYLVRQKQFGEQWAIEDQQVRAKLTALEKRYGKKPNIVFILADDIGYTELGTYGVLAVPVIWKVVGFVLNVYYRWSVRWTSRIASGSCSNDIKDGMASIINSLQPS